MCHYFSTFEESGYISGITSERAPAIYSKRTIEGEFKAFPELVHKFLEGYGVTSSIGRRVDSGRSLTAEIKQLAERMRADDETSAYQLPHLRTKEGYSISLHTILQRRIPLGWIFRGSTYCELIRSEQGETAQQHLSDSFKVMG